VIIEFAQKIDNLVLQKHREVSGFETKLAQSIKRPWWIPINS
jgi:hypothetical protein